MSSGFYDRVTVFGKNARKCYNDAAEYVRSEQKRKRMMAARGWAVARLETVSSVHQVNCELAGARLLSLGGQSPREVSLCLPASSAG